MDRGELDRLSKAELIEAYLVLQGKLQRPAKTSRTSSKPPSLDRKERREQAKPGGAKPGHKGHFRALHEAPDEVVDYRPNACPQCHCKLDADLRMELIGEYDEIELPALQPFVRRHRRFAGVCLHCQAKAKAKAPAGSPGLAVWAASAWSGALSQELPFGVVCPA